MTSSSLVIVADRGNLKAYAIEKGAVRRNARLVLERRIEEAHGRYRDKVTDQAGAFATGGGGPGGFTATSIAERDRPGMEAEEDRKIFIKIGDQINTLVREHGQPQWSFAAPAEINSLILEKVDPTLRKLIETNVARDLVKIPGAELLEHFDRHR